MPKYRTWEICSQNIHIVLKFGRRMITEFQNESESPKVNLVSLRASGSYHETSYRITAMKNIIYTNCLCIIYYPIEFYTPVLCMVWRCRSVRPSISFVHNYKKCFSVYIVHICGLVWNPASQLIKNAHHDPLTHLQPFLWRFIQQRFFTGLSFIKPRHFLLQGPQTYAVVWDCYCCYYLYSVFLFRKSLGSFLTSKSYHQISWCLEVARLDVKMIASLWNLTGNSVALLSSCLSDIIAIRPNPKHPNPNLAASRLREILR